MLFSSILLMIAGGIVGSMTPIDTLAEAHVAAEKVLIVSSRETLKLTNASSFSDAMLTLPSIQLSDGGGISSLKTISFRGLGSSHTGIMIDGIRSVNVQSGQNDLGMLCIEDYENAVVDYATNSISFNTLKPASSGGSINFSAGSFNSYQGHADYSYKFNGGSALKASATGLYSKGDFPYRADLRRTGNDIRKIQAGLDFFLKETHLKVYYNGSNRGTPGSISWPSEDRQEDDNFFVQGRWQHVMSDVYTLKTSAKVSHDRLAYSTSYGNSLYNQTVALANIVNRFRISSWFSTEANLDMEYDYLAADFSAQRLSFKPTVAFTVDLPKFKSSLAIDYQITKDKDNETISIPSPAVQLMYQPLRSLSFTGFSRRAYRIPTFNELYYTGFGNANLKPEDAWLFDAGIILDRSFGKLGFKANADIFYNYLKNKIISAPTEADPNIWLPYNIGTADNLGTDLSFALSYASNLWKSSIAAKYSYMNALDKTKGSATFGHQLSYVPKHSASIIADASYRKTCLIFNWTLRAGRRDSYGEMPNWNTLDLTLRQCLGKCIQLALYGHNITNQKYEISTGYPMPGISVTGVIEICF